MDLSSYFSPLPEENRPVRNALDAFALGDYTRGYFDEFPSLMEADLVIIGCEQDRGAREIGGAGMAPNLIRKHLYKLTVPRGDVKVVDLGNLRSREKMVDYYDNLATVCWEVLRRGKVLILIGGSQDIVYGQYMGYERSQQQVELVCVDSNLDVEDSDFGINNHTYNHKIFVHSPNYLFNFTNLGFQSHFVSVGDRKRLRNLYFPAIRLGELKEDIREAEPYLRGADLVSFDLSVVRSADAPGSSQPCPAGFSTEEFCQLAWYAGMSDKVSSVSFCEAHPIKDFNEQTILLTALSIWYFIDGYYNRKDELPLNFEAMTKYTLSLQDGAYEVVFYENKRTDRWYMEVPYTDSINDPEGRHKVIPCSQKDYEYSRDEDELPEKWWWAHHKLM